MRALVYAAGAYALCMGTAEAFAPQTAVPASTTLTKVKDSHVGERSAPAGALSAWQPYGGYVPESQRAQQPQQVEPMGGQSPMTAAATLEHAYAAPAADKPQSGWKPYGGYDPKNRRPPAAEPAADVMARAYAPAASAPAAAAPEKKWSPPVGYVPGGSSTVTREDNTAVMARVSEMMGSSATAPMTNAPAKKWQPYGGYDPKNRGAPAASSAPAAMSAPAYSAPASAAPAYSAPESSGPVAMTNAPAKKWQPYGGYDPKNRGPPSSAGYSSAPIQGSMETDPLSSAPAKKWQPYGGYDPKSRGAPARSASSNDLYAPSAAAPAAAAPSYQSYEAAPAPTAAPAKKWVPYGGYDPKSRGAPAASKPWSPPVGYAPSAAAPAPLSNAEVDIYASSATKMTNAPDKKWQPYGGYDPKSRR